MGRRLGQHFLIRQSIVEKIAEAVCPSACDLAVEIGPGRGALTRPLLGRASRVIAIEIDPVLAQYLRAKFRDISRLEVLEADILKTDLAQWGPVAIVGNLPYYITSPIVEKCVALRNLAIRMVFLTQSEVAARLTAAPGSRDYGYLSVLTQFFTETELLFTVPAAAFRPPPKVESTVVRLTPRTQLPSIDARGFLRFAAQCFTHKRKTLRNNLAGHYERESIDALPEAGLRAEQISVTELVGIFERLKDGEGAN